MRKKRQFKAGRCYHLVSRIAHRAFFFDEESTHAAGVAPIDQPEKWDVQHGGWGIKTGRPSFAI